MNIAVVGLGKIGSALVAQYTSRGHHVVGCDINPRTVAMIDRGQAPMDEPGVQEHIAHASAAGRLRATLDIADAVAACQVVVVAVPLLINDQRRPDYRAIDAATRDIARGLRPGALVSYETTLPIGDTRNHFAPILTELSGLQLGEDLFLSYSPERVKSGRILRDLRLYPKIVGGVDAESTRVAASFYREALNAAVIEARSTEIAEFAKLAASYYRDVNIALANELAVCAQEYGIDGVEGIELANTDPTSAVHAPGIGVGGHCIPVYPYFLINRCDATDLIATARRRNDGMAAYSVNLLQSLIGPLHGKRVVVLGLAFRDNVKEATFSMAHLVVQALRQAGAIPSIHDPLFEDAEIRALGYQPINLDSDTAVDAFILQSFHTQHRSLDFTRFNQCQAFIDGRNALPADMRAALPCIYRGIGRGSVQPPSQPERLPARAASAGRSME